MAGLAAARTLLESGLNDIIILEAQDHAGGRVLSKSFHDCWIEAGAQWIHGQKNEVWRLANEFNLLAECTSSEGEGPYMREDGVVLEPSLVFEVDSVISGILTKCEKFSKMSGRNVEVPASIGEYLQSQFLKYLNSCSSDSKEIRQLKEELFDWHVRFQKIDNSSLMLDNLSAKSWGNYSFCGGDDYVNFKEGFSSLINKLTDCLPDGILHLNSPVSHIRWEKDISILPNGIIRHYPVVISSSSGLNISAQHCIVTCSLGFLKENYETLFDPVLPFSLIKAIKDLGFATINKIFLAYEQPWWAPDIKGFQLIWSKNLSNSTYASNSWLRDLTGFDVLPNVSGVLLGWIGGDGAKQIELLSAEEVGHQCTDLLRHFTKRKDIPEPCETLRTQWHNNPYIRGGYSHTTSACDMSDIGPATLAQPVYATTAPGQPEYPVILLAGEAAHECYFSTTHGAYESGQNQAKVILKYQGLK